MDQPNQPRLFSRFPGLRGKTPFRSLGIFPTPVQRMEKLEQRLGASALFVKRDDLSGETYGGNKVRKLEFVLADAANQGRGPIITLGAVGSNHVLATTLYAKKLGIQVIGVMIPQPVQANLRVNLMADLAQGCRIEYAPSNAAVAGKIASLCAREWGKNRRRPYLLWAGGSSRLGVLGYVEAGLEIGAQVREGLLPEPKFVFVPVGSGGTLAGLTLGLRFAGLFSRAVGVRVYNRSTANERVVAFMANWTLAWLQKRDPAILEPKIKPAEIMMLHDYFGAGYSQYTTKGVAAMKLAQDLEGLVLDGSYSGKNMDGFIDFMSRPEHRGQPALFINTYNSRPTEHLLAGAPSWQSLPPALREYFTQDLAPVSD